MDYGGAWFSWCDAQILRSAWRQCGWLGCTIAPEEIDRECFVDRESPATPATPRLLAPPPLDQAIDLALAVPEDMQACSQRRCSCRLSS